MNPSTYSFADIDGVKLPSPEQDDTTLVVGGPLQSTTGVARYRVAQHLANVSNADLHCIAPRAGTTSASSGDTIERWYAPPSMQEVSIRTLSHQTTLQDDVYIAADPQREANVYHDFIETYGECLAGRDTPLVLAIDNVSSFWPWLPRLLSLVDEVSPSVAVVVAANTDLLDILRSPYEYASVICYADDGRSTSAVLESSASAFLEQDTNAPRVVTRRSHTSNSDYYELTALYQDYDLRTALCKSSKL